MITAGLHGDERTSVYGLLAWLKGANLGNHLELGIDILPCLNPHGFFNSLRESKQGDDLNRQFHNSSHPLVAAVSSYLADRSYWLAVDLHEDFESDKFKNDFLGMLILIPNSGIPIFGILFSDPPSF